MFNAALEAFILAEWIGLNYNSLWLMARFSFGFHKQLGYRWNVIHKLSLTISELFCFFDVLNYFSSNLFWAQP